MVSKDTSKEKGTRLVSARVSDKLSEDLIYFAALRNTSRSQIAADALEFYANAKQCVICGEMNPGKAEHCFSCGSDLFSDEAIQAAIFGLCKDGEYDSMSGGKMLDKVDDLLKAGFEKKYVGNVPYLPDDKKGFFGSLCLDLDGLTVNSEEMDTHYHISPERLYERLKKDRENGVPGLNLKIMYSGSK